MDIVTVRSNGQITLPAAVRRAVNLAEGDVLTVEVREGALVLRPKVLVDKEQAYFYSRRWQAGEQAAEKDIQQGHMRTFASAKEMVETICREVGIDPTEVE